MYTFIFVNLKYHPFTELYLEIIGEGKWLNHISVSLFMISRPQNCNSYITLYLENEDLTEHCAVEELKVEIPY